MGRREICTVWNFNVKTSVEEAVDLLIHWYEENIKMDFSVTGRGGW
jgi:hypothetical protein